MSIIISDSSAGFSPNSMDKQQLLSSIATAAAEKTLTKKDIVDAFDRGRGKAGGSGLSIGEILYYIGGAIIFIGIAVLVFQNWLNLPSAAQILVTFGSGLAAYFMGLAFLRDPHLEKMGHTFFFLSAILTPLGLFVIFHDRGYELTAGVHSVIYALLFAMFMASFLAIKKEVFLLFSILFGTGLYFALINFLVDDFPLVEEWRFNAYQVLVAGISYILLGYYFSKNNRPHFTGFLYAFGILGFLSAGLALGGWTPDQSVFWELAFPGLVFGAIFLSIYLQAKSFLVFGSIFLMIYILKITAEYFTEGLGWPLSLVLAGFALIGIGYLSFYLNRKYIAKE